MPREVQDSAIRRSRMGNRMLEIEMAFSLQEQAEQGASAEWLVGIATGTRPA